MVKLLVGVVRPFIARAVPSSLEASTVNWSLTVTWCAKKTNNPDDLNDGTNLFDTLAGSKGRSATEVSKNGYLAWPDAVTPDLRWPMTTKLYLILEGSSRLGCRSCKGQTVKWANDSHTPACSSFFSDVFPTWRHTRNMQIVPVALCHMTLGNIGLYEIPLVIVGTQRKNIGGADW